MHPAVVARRRRCVAPQAAARAVHDGGVDLNSGIVFNHHLLNATRSGTLPAADVDRALARTLRVRAHSRAWCRRASSRGGRV